MSTLAARARCHVRRLPPSLYRFALVGLFNNAVLLMIYACATALGADRQIAVVLVFLLGLVQGFALNKSFAFRFKGRGTSAFRRYLLVYLFALVADVLLLEGLVWLGVNHVLAQGILIVLVAAALFVALERFVFQERPVRSS